MPGCCRRWSPAPRPWNFLDKCYVVVGLEQYHNSSKLENVPGLQQVGNPHREVNSFSSQSVDQILLPDCFQQAQQYTTSRGQIFTLSKNDAGTMDAETLFIADPQLRDAVTAAVLQQQQQHAGGCLLYTSPSPRDRG